LFISILSENKNKLERKGKREASKIHRGNRERGGGEREVRENKSAE
jgi:hypothetical protein